jgi:uncharacterized SAM-binding protein YcdF (DUF218 family)
MFFYPAKLLWFLLQPSSVMMVALAVALWSLPYELKRARRLIWGALAIGLAGWSPLANLMFLSLEQRFQRADLTKATVTGFIILGGGEEARIALARHAHALNDEGERLSEAVTLAKLLPQARVVFSGGTAAVLPGVETEAQASREMLISMGVPSERIITEGRSRDTYENALFTKQLVQPQPGQRWLVVTSAWHMPRAMGVFRAINFPVEPWPVDYKTAGWQNGLQFHRSAADGLKRLEMITKEYVGLITYWLTGRSTSLLPGPKA